MGVRQELPQEQQRAEGRVEAGEMTESQRRWGKGKREKEMGGERNDSGGKTSLPWSFRRFGVWSRRAGTNGLDIPAPLGS